jgi:hypothetical protein
MIRNYCHLRGECLTYRGPVRLRHLYPVGDNSRPSFIFPRSTRLEPVRPVRGRIEADQPDGIAHR